MLESFKLPAFFLKGKLVEAAFTELGKIVKLASKHKTPSQVGWFSY